MAGPCSDREPMSVYSKYAPLRSLWMGPGQNPYAIEIFTDEGVAAGAVNDRDGRPPASELRNTSVAS